MATSPAQLEPGRVGGQFEYDGGFARREPFERDEFEYVALALGESVEGFCQRRCFVGGIDGGGDRLFFEAVEVKFAVGALDEESGEPGFASPLPGKDPAGNSIQPRRAVSVSGM